MSHSGNVQVARRKVQESSAKELQTRTLNQSGKTEIMIAAIHSKPATASGPAPLFARGRGTV